MSSCSIEYLIETTWQLDSSNFTSLSSFLLHIAPSIPLADCTLYPDHNAGSFSSCLTVSSVYFPVSAPVYDAVDRETDVKVAPILYLSRQLDLSLDLCTIQQKFSPPILSYRIYHWNRLQTIAATLQFQLFPLI